MKYTIVVAEDEEILLNNLIGKIEKFCPDFEVIGKAQTGEQALALFMEESPDILITDIKMPVMDGLELIEKARDFYPFMKTVITSGYSDFEYAKKAISLKVSDYLLKPVDTDELKEVLNKLKNEYNMEKNDYEEVFNLTTSSLTPSQIADLLHDFITKNYASDINLNMIANSMNYSSSYLTRIFCQYYSCTPSKYLLNLRISTAQKYLRLNPELSVRQIGEMVGYQDQGYFSRIFKKIAGLSPLDYRAEQSKNG